MLPDTVDSKVLEDQLLQKEVDRLVKAGDLQPTERPRDGWTLKDFLGLPVRPGVPLE